MTPQEHVVKKANIATKDGKVGNPNAKHGPKIDDESSRSQWLVRSGKKGVGQNVTFKYGTWRTKEEALVEANKCKRKMMAILAAQCD